MEAQNRNTSPSPGSAIRANRRRTKWMIRGATSAIEKFTTLEVVLALEQMGRLTEVYTALECMRPPAPCPQRPSSGNDLDETLFNI